MTDYRRHRVRGGRYFFTMNLAERRLSLLMQHGYVQPERVGTRDGKTDVAGSLLLNETSVVELKG